MLGEPAERYLEDVARRQTGGDREFRQGFEGDDLVQPTVRGDEPGVEWQCRVAHPEDPSPLAGVDEQHAVTVGQGRAVHQAVLTFTGFVGHLYGQRDISDSNLDGRQRRLRAVPSREQARQEQGDEQQAWNGGVHPVILPRWCA